jgi:predicted Zn-dependent peptidase
VDQIATDVSVNMDDREIAGLMDVELTAKPGIPLSRLETAFREELDRLLRDGPTQAELDRHKTQILAGFIRASERVGGFGGKSDILAQYQTYQGDPGAWRSSLARVRDATPAQVAAAGRRWLSDGAFTLEVTPFPDFAPIPGTVTAAAIPAPGAPPAPRFPGFETATLPNGLKVVVAQRHETPMVAFDLVVNAGDITDPAGLTGLAGLDAATMLDGTADLDALAFDDRKTALGVELGLSTGRDTSQVELSAPSSRLGPALDLMADIVLRPAFRAADLAREKALTIARIEQLKGDPVDEAIRLTFPLTYGPDHPYGRLATEASVAKVSVEDVQRHHRAWFTARGATLVVVGDTTLQAVLPAIQARFGAWSADGPATPSAPAATPAPTDVVYLVDKPGALQSVICASLPAPTKLDPDDLAIRAMITSLGGAFTSRLNMNLREDKHWAYGAFAFVEDARGPGLFLALAPVQTDKTKESFSEVRRELTEVVSTRPLTAHELELSQHNLTQSLSGRWETDRAVSGSLAEIAVYGLPSDYYDTYARRISALTQADVQRAATKVVKPASLTWIVVGDRSVIQKPLESLGLKVQVVDADGAPTP